MAGPALTVLRFYNGMTREFVIERWSHGLRHGGLLQTENVLHRPLFGGHTAMCVYGALCHVLQLPATPIQTRHGLVFGYQDFDRSAEPEIDALPHKLHSFLCPVGKSKLRIDLAAVAAESPVLFTKILLDTKLTREQIMLMEPTLAGLNDRGVKFSTLALLIESKYW